MIFAGGQIHPDAALPELLTGIPRTLQGPPLEAKTVISALESLGEVLDSGALDPLIRQYAPPGAREELEQVRPQLSREVLEARLALELGGLAGPRPFGRAEVRPLGVLFHVAPGNMAGLPAYTALEGLLTGNLNLVKLPHGDRGLTPAIFQKLTELEPALAPWLWAFDVPSRNTDTLQRLAAMADGVVVWGGDGAVESMRRLAPPGCRLMEWGHRLSFAYLSGETPPEDLEALADHIIRTGGLLCSSCQVIFLDTEDLGAAEAFCQNFLPLLEHAARAGRRTIGQRGQAALHTHETFLEYIVGRKTGEDGARMFRGRGCSLTLRPGRELELSPLHGNVLVKCLPRRELISALFPRRGRLQTAGLLCPPEDRAALTALLAQAGVNRVTTAGHMSSTFPGEAHDGALPLARYVRVVDIESTKSIL